MSRRKAKHVKLIGVNQKTEQEGLKMARHKKHTKVVKGHKGGHKKGHKGGHKRRGHKR
jgi:hypothetical protein